MNDIDAKIKEIDAQLEELEKEEKLMPKREVREIKDQTQDAIEAVRECVEEVLEIEDLKKSRDEDPKLYSNRMLTIVSWFDYLKWEKIDTPEYEEAKNLIISMGEKHPRIADWCRHLIEAEKPEPPVTLWDAELNVDKTNELIIEDGAKIVVDAEQAKKVIDTEWVLGTKEYNELELQYDVVVDGQVYNHLYHVVDYLPRCEKNEECPYIVHLAGWEKKDNNERVLKFNVLEIGKRRN